MDILSGTRGWYVTVYTQERRLGRLIDLVSKAAVWQFEYRTDWIPEAALSPDGRFLATEATASTHQMQTVLDVHDLDTGAPAARLTSQLGVLRNLAFSPDGRHLMCSGESSGAIYESPGFTQVASFDAQARARPAFAPGEPLLALPSSQRYEVRLWDWVRNEETARFDGPSQVFWIGFTPDRHCLVAASTEAARVYHLRRTPEKLALPYHLGNQPGVAFSPDGLHVAAVGARPAVRVCDAATGQELWSSETVPLQGHSPVFSHDSRWLATADYVGKRVIVWDARTGEQLLEIEPRAGGRLWSVQFSPDGGFLATASGINRTNHHGVEVWKLEGAPTGGPGQKPRATCLKSAGAAAWSLAFSPDGRQVAFVDRDLHRACLWAFEEPSSPRPLEAKLVHGIGNDQSLCFTRDGGQLLLVDPKRNVLAFDALTGQQTSSFPTVDPQRTLSWTQSASICLSPDGAKLAMISASGCGVDIWNTSSGELLYALPETDDSVHWLAWPANSERLAITRSNGDTEIGILEEIQAILTKLALGS